MRLSAATIGELLYHNADDAEARAALIEAVQDPLYVRTFEYNPVDGLHTLVTGRRSERGIEAQPHARWTCCSCPACEARNAADEDQDVSPGVYSGESSANPVRLAPHPRWCCCTACAPPVD